MVSRDCLDGARKLRLSPYLSTPTSKVSRSTGKRGIHQSGGPACSPNRCSTDGTMLYCFEPSRPCDWMYPFLIRSRILAASDQGWTLRKIAPDLRSPIDCDVDL